MVNSAIGAYYYLRIIVMMYMREPRKQVPVAPIPLGLGLALAISVVATLYLGILPNRVLQYAQQSAQDLLPSAAAPASSGPRPASRRSAPSTIDFPVETARTAFDKGLRGRA